MKYILFDLDGTLLPMKQDDFIKDYFSRLAMKFIKFGIEPKQFKTALFSGVEAMVKNDGCRSNEDAFWDTFLAFVPGDLALFKSSTMDFYQNEFNEVIHSTQPTEWASKVIRAAKDKGLQVYLATNPLFPQIATAQRIRWAGLDFGDFVDVTTYENCHYCKPNVAYFQELINKHHLPPEECIMVGNDVGEDLVISQLGVETYLVTNTMENKYNLPITADHIGTLEDLYYFIQKL